MAQQRTQPPRQYGAEEVQEILQRTASLERKKQLERPTLGLDEIEAIAKEAGLDPALVRRAAQEFEQKSGEKSAGSRFVGAPLRQVFEREVDGEVSAAMHEQLANDIKTTLGARAMMGQVSSVGRIITWTAIARKGGGAELSIFPRDGKTIIRIEVNYSQVAGGIFGGLMGGLGGSLGVNLLWLLPTVAQLPWYAGVGALGAAMAGSWGLARLIYGAIANRTARRVDEVMETLEKRVRETVTTR
jgi:hypothetical protein